MAWNGYIAVGTLTSGTFTELAATGYVRQPWLFGDLNFGRVSAIGPGADFGRPSGAPWSYNAYAFYVAPTGGTPTLVYPLSASYSVAAGVRFLVPVNGLSIDYADRQTEAGITLDAAAVATIAGQAVSAVSVPIASSSQAGAVKPVGTDFNVGGDGALSLKNPGGGGPGSDTTAARLVDPRFRGIERVDLRAAYGAPCDGASHPMTAAAALAAYPQCAATGTIERDTAAWLQAEYDIRTGSAGTGVIGLPDGADMRVSQTLVLQDASRVWFHGGRRVSLHTAQCGTNPAIQVMNCPIVATVLRDFSMFAKATSVSPSSSGGGAVWNGYAVGAIAIRFDNVQGVRIERVGWNGYDSPMSWGDHIYGITFNTCGGGGCNYGLNWGQTTSLDSMERIIFQNGALANNNYGFYWDATYGPNKEYAQGGSIFIQDTAIDYNVVRQGVYIGAPVNNTYAGSSMHITRCHIETTGACSGSAKARILSQGTMFLSHNEMYENDGTVPAGFVEVADQTACSMLNNRINNTVMALMYSSTGNPKRTTALGNVMQDINVRPIEIVDSNGSHPQAASDDGYRALLFSDPAPFDAVRFFGKRTVILHYFDGPAPFTLDDHGFPVGYSFDVKCCSGAITFAVKAGQVLTSFPGNAFRLTTVGASVTVVRNSPTEWLIVGPLVA